TATPPAVTGTPTAAVVGTPYSYAFAVTGTPTPVVAVTTGTLPAGLSLDPDTGVLSGTPTTAGSFPLTITATNGVGNPATLDVTVTVTAVPVVDPPATGSLGSSGSIFGS
ncbi:putative Ig domain-containing protein, partial [Rhodococcus sp. IEGM 1379]|uniref:putative Ig domain-containing protein n=1 Tax=Rhodococcus sp. IEGM 1379 TaxID=3047086 RepID=UPI0024B78A47